MTRLTIDLPDSLHKTLKSLSVVDGQTMRNIAISALERYAVSRVGKEKDINENEVDELLKPVLLKYVEQIEEGKFEWKSWEEIKKEVE